MRRLEGKVCAITGGAGTIGKAMTARFIEEGARVVVADYDAEKLDKVAERPDLVKILADVTRPEGAEAVVNAAMEHFGSLDALVNNAAYWVNDGSVMQISLEDWNLIIAGTLTSAFLCSKYAVPVMIAQGGGVILNIASVNAIFGLGLAAYSAAKGGMLSLTQTMAAQHGAQGIRVVAISPGTIHTEAWEPILAENPNALKEWEARYLLHRVGKPEEVAALAAHLISDEAANTTGANFVMDGGLSAGLEIPAYRLVK